MTRAARGFLFFPAFLAFVLAVGGCNMIGGGTEGQGLSGTFVDAQGTPVAGAWVSAYPSSDSLPAAAKQGAARPAADSALTGEDGKFLLKRLSEGTYNLFAETRRHGTVLSAFIREVEYGGKQLDLGTDTLRAPGSVTLQVTGEGAPLDSATCRIAGTPWENVSGVSGACDLPDLPAGTYQITVSHPSFETAVSGTITIAPGGIVTGLSLNLLPRTPGTSEDRHFAALPSTVALWTFNSRAAGRFMDAGPNAFTLSSSGDASLTPSPFGSALAFTGGTGTLWTGYDALLSPLETGLMTLDARIRIDAYPAPSVSGGVSHILGIGSGPNLEITHEGRVQTTFTRQSPGGSTILRTYRSDSAVVPKGTWVNLAVALDAREDTVRFYAYVNNVPVQLYGRLDEGDLSQEEANLTIGSDGDDGKPFSGLIEEIRLSNALVHGPGLPTAEDTSSMGAFKVTPETVALWRFSARDAMNRVLDLGPNGFHLTTGNTIPLEPSPLDSAAVFDGTSKSYTLPYNDLLNVGVTGSITYEARIFMTQYPAASNFNNAAVVMGMYAGPALLILSDGTINIKTQKLNGSTSYWYHPLHTLPNAVPLNEWVTVAASVDANASPKQVYLHVNGVPVQLYGGSSDDEFRIYTESSFAVGNDTRDHQPFRGKVEEMRVSNTLVLGEGLPVAPPPPDFGF